MKTKTFPYRPEIDGLRALAVLSVFIYHLNPQWLAGGFLGVDIFFVISGFLITSIISIKVQQHQFSFQDFYTRRIKRIAPPFVLILFLASLFGIAFFDWHSFELLRKTIEITGAFLSNLYISYRQGYWDLQAGENPIIHIWSLAIEEQYYLLYPLFLIFCLKRFKQNTLFKSSVVVFMVLVLMSFLPRGLYKHIGLYNDYYISTLRFPELLIGSLLALMPWGKASQQPSTYSFLSFTALIGLISCLIFYHPHLPHLPGIALLLPCIFTALLIFSMQNHNAVQRLFSLKPVVFIGKISYSLYLFHWLFIAFAHFITGQNNLSFEAVGIIVPLTFICAILSYYFLEQPARKSKLHFKQSLVWFYVLPMIMTIVMNQFGRHYVDHRSEALNARYDKGMMLAPNPFPEKVAVIGDSHAGHLRYFLNVIGTKEGWHAKYVQHTPFEETPFNHCYLRDSDANPNADCTHPTAMLDGYPVVIISMFYNLKRGIKPLPRTAVETFMSQDFERDFVQMVKDIAKNHKVIVLGDVKNISLPQIRKLLLDKYGIGKLLPDVHEMNNTTQTNQEIAQMVQGIPNVIYLDPTQYLYPKAKNFFIDGKPLYRDQDHLNYFGSYMMGKTFSENARFMPEEWIKLLQ